MWQSCDLRKQLSSISTTKDWWVREKTAHSAYIDECTDLDEWHSQRVRFDFALHGVTGTADELMWNHKEQYISALGSVEQIWHCHLRAREREERTRGEEREESVWYWMMKPGETCMHSIYSLYDWLHLQYGAMFYVMDMLAEFVSTSSQNHLVHKQILLVAVPCLCCICQWFSRPLAQSSSEPS